MGNFSNKPVVTLLLSLLTLLVIAALLFGDKGIWLRPSISLSIFWFSLFLFMSAVISGLLVFMVMNNQLNRIKRLSNTDGLTGLYGSREIRRLLSYDVERSRRYHGELSLILLDVDKFATINDEYGVKIGDALLQKISHLLLNGIKYVNREEKEFHGIRSSDIAFRYEGQDRILIILPETSAKGAYIAAERIREAIMFTAFSSGNNDQKIRTTVSAAVASFNGKEDTVESLLARAEMLLLKAKITRNSSVMENPLSTLGTPYDTDASISKSTTC